MIEIRRLPGIRWKEHRDLRLEALKIVGLYKKYGFKKIGIMKKDLYVNGRFYDEMVMEKYLK